MAAVPGRTGGAHRRPDGVDGTISRRASSPDGDRFITSTGAACSFTNGATIESFVHDLARGAAPRSHPGARQLRPRPSGCCCSGKYEDFFALSTTANLIAQLQLAMCREQGLLLRHGHRPQPRVLQLGFATPARAPGRRSVRYRQPVVAGADRLGPAGPGRVHRPGSVVVDRAGDSSTRVRTVSWISVPQLADFTQTRPTSPRWRRRQGSGRLSGSSYLGPSASRRPHLRPATNGGVADQVPPSVASRSSTRRRSPRAHVGRPRRVRARRAGWPLHGPPRRRPVHGRGGQHAPGDRMRFEGLRAAPAPVYALLPRYRGADCKVYGLSPPRLPGERSTARKGRSTSRCPRPPRTEVVRRRRCSRLVAGEWRRPRGRPRNRGRVRGSR